ncbi:MAG: protein translocase subunit SecD [Asticcacaulis sp.]|nr:protein translocase subunit SecD [Asticcacaulis sp.]
MINLSRWKIGVVLAAILLGVLCSLPNFLPADVRDQLKPYPFVPSKTLNLGLDLQGGSYLLLEVDIDDLKKTKLTNIIEGARDSLTKEGIQFTGPTSDANSVSVRINDPNQVKDAVRLLNRLASPLASNPNARDLTVAAGDNQTVRLALTDEGIRSSSVQAVDNSIEIIRKRIDPKGVKEVSIQKQGIDRIAVEAPGESDPEQLKRLIGQTAKLTFQMVDESVSPEEIAANRIPPGTEILSMDKSGAPLAVRKAILVSGTDLRKATVGRDQYNRPAIDFTFNSSGAQKFGSATRANIGKRFAIILDGRVMSAPVIQGVISGGTGQITGDFQIEEASELVNVLNGGALPAKLKFESQRTVGAELGKDAIDKGMVSTAVGFAVIVLFMFLAYGFVFGGASIAALLVKQLLIFASMTFFHITLTLPGIAGLVLSLAVAVDANVLIYERIRDEERTGHKPVAAMDVGYERALVSIMDANITSAIAAVIMLGFGAGPVKGFAWSLLIGVMTSVFSAILVSQVLLGWWYRAARPKKLPI